MRISVVIPTFRRPESLKTCLAALQAQERAADEILVVTRVDDPETMALLSELSSWSTLKEIRQSGTGAVRQYNAGLEASTGDIVAFTDDDTAAHIDWLRRIEAHFLHDPLLGGVGGRDLVYEENALLEGHARLVGEVQWFGRIVGNHHIGTQMRRNIWVLKGVNMAFRAAALEGIRFDPDLRGTGAQTSLDLAFSFDVHAKGWKLLFDPAVALDHYPARRFDANQRAEPSLQAVEESSYNYYLTLRRHMKHGVQRHLSLLWARLVGMERSPGSLRALRALLKRDHRQLQYYALARRAWKDARKKA